MTDYEFPWTFLIVSSIIGHLGGVLNIYTLIVILVATPKNMIRYKYYLLLMQFFSTIFDLLINFLEVEIYLPAMACRFYGIFYTIFGMNVTWAMVIGFISIWGMVGGTTACFLFRHQQVLPSDHWINLGVTKWSWILVAHGVPYIGGGLYGIWSFPFEHPPNASGLSKLIEVYPQNAYLQYEADTWIGDPNALLSPPIFDLTCVQLLLYSTLCPVVEIPIVGSLFVYHSFYMLKQNSTFMSEKTRQMHRKLILALICQAVVPVITIVIPFSILALLLVLGQTLPQGVLNANSINITLHGKISSILIIALTQPYRKFCLDQLKQMLKFVSISKKLKNYGKSKVRNEEIKTLS